VTLEQWSAAAFTVAFFGAMLFGYLLGRFSHEDNPHTCCKDDGDTPLYPPKDWTVGSEFYRGFYGMPKDRMPL